MAIQFGLDVLLRALYSNQGTGVLSETECEFIIGAVAGALIKVSTPEKVARALQRIARHDLVQLMADAEKSVEKLLKEMADKKGAGGSGKRSREDSKRKPGASDGSGGERAQPNGA
jgi:hypothetical protein